MNTLFFSAAIISGGSGRGDGRCRRRVVVVTVHSNEALEVMGNTASSTWLRMKAVPDFLNKMIV